MLAALCATGCAQRRAKPTADAAPERLRARVVHVYPHDREAFTQGLEVFEGQLLESTGLLGRSSIRRVDLESGAVLARAPLAEDVFGEGLARVGARVWQITWRNGRAFTWDVRALRVLSEMPYTGEGWGLCYDGKRLVMSDGSARLTFRDADSFAVLGEVTVRQSGAPVTELNELECVDGSVYANVWQQDRIVRIDPATGSVTATIDASGLLEPAERGGTDVLNGIAWWPEHRRFLITGKLWPHVYEVELVSAP